MRKGEAENIIILCLLFIVILLPSMDREMTEKMNNEVLIIYVSIINEEKEAAMASEGKIKRHNKSIASSINKNKIK